MLAAACSEGAATAPGNGVVVTPAQTQTPDAQPTNAPNDPTSTAGNNGPELHGFIFPIAGGCLPSGDNLMPNARRAYRNGTHEGIDFYNVDNCTQIGLGTPVIAAKAGRVVRADHNYRDPTIAEMNRLQEAPEGAEALDVFRGRQVWVDHGNGVITRYCHLDGIAPGIQVGTMVSQGQVIAFVGESGTPESVYNPRSGREYHLHFEVRVGDTYLGAGESPQRVRELYNALFAR
jgi:murein DD-endopeptidase MepM/ murein hydrolase activator NlpD